MFINRIDEKKTIGQKIIENRNKNIVILIYGEHGQGKTALMQEIFNLENIADKLLQIQGTYDSNVTDLFYIESLLSEIKKDKGPLTYGLSSVKRKGEIIGKKVVNQHFLNIFDETSKTEKYNTLFEFLNTDARYYISIQNFQFIDSESRDIILQLLRETSCNVFIFEITGTNDIYSLERHLEACNIQTYSREVDMLDWNEIKKLINKTIVTEQNMEDIKKYYFDMNGNLWKVMKKYNKYFNIVENEYNILNNTQRIILLLVALNQNQIKLNELNEILKTEVHISKLYLSTDGINDDVEQLRNHGFIDITENENVFLGSKNTIDSVLQESKGPLGHIAFSALKEYHLSNNNISNLFRLLIEFRDLDELISIFYILKHTILNAKYPEKYLLQFDLLINDLHYTNQYYEQIVAFVATISIQLEDLKLTKKYLTKLNKKTNKFKFLNNIYLILFDKTLDSSMIDNIIDNYKQKHQLQLILTIYKIKRMMEYCRSEDTILELKNALDNDDFKEFKEYYYLLRNKAEFCDMSESLELYNECLKYIDTDIDKQQIYLSISMMHAHSGDLEQAKKYIRFVEESKSLWVHESIVLNNSAVIKMLEGNNSNSVLSMLKKADLFNDIEYNKIIIKCNLLVIYINQEDWYNALETYKEIRKCNLRDYQYEELQHIVYQNMYYYNKLIKNHKEATECKKKIEKIIDTNLNTYTSNLATLQLGNKKGKLHYSQFPYRVDFLGYWDINLNLDDYLLDT